METLTVSEAFKAWEHAQETIIGCESTDELDKASDYKEAARNCPKGFTLAQRLLAQSIILRAYEKAIGRA